MKVLRLLLYAFLILCLNGCSLLVLVNQVASKAPILPAAWEWEVKRVSPYFVTIGFGLVVLFLISFWVANELMQRGYRRAGLALLTVPVMWGFLLIYSQAGGFLFSQYFLKPCKALGEQVLQRHQHFHAPVEPFSVRPKSVDLLPQTWPAELNKQFRAEFRKLNLQAVVVRDSAVYFIRYQDSHYSEVYVYAPQRSSSFMKRHGHRLDRVPASGSLYDLSGESSAPH
jgi:hypothetical protein